MPENKKDALLWIALAVGGYYAYKWWQKRGAGTYQRVELTSQPSTLTNPTNIPTSGTVAPPPPGNTTGPVPAQQLFTQTTTPIPPVTGSMAPDFTQPADTASTLTPAEQKALAAGIDPVAYGIVQKWGLTDGRPPVIAMLAADIPAEYAGMWDIITNYWDKGIKVTPGSQQEIFWDNLRNKYDPTHISW